MKEHGIKNEELIPIKIKIPENYMNLDKVL